MACAPQPFIISVLNLFDQTLVILIGPGSAKFGTVLSPIGSRQFLQLNLAMLVSAGIALLCKCTPPPPRTRT